MIKDQQIVKILEKISQKQLSFLIFWERKPLPNRRPCLHSIVSLFFYFHELFYSRIVEFNLSNYKYSGKRFIQSLGN